jgi:hypothetical protein
MCTLARPGVPEVDFHAEPVVQLLLQGVVGLLGSLLWQLDQAAGAGHAGPPAR